MRVNTNDAGVLVVIPALNEAASVGEVVRLVQQKASGCDVLVVDDGSRDATAEVARAAGALVLQLPFNLGVGGAMRLGFRYARDHGYRAVVQVDADGQHDAADVPRLVARLGELDLVIGARFAGAGSYEVRGPRKWAMNTLSKILSRSAGTTLNDTTSGFRASGEKCIALFAEHYPAEYLGDTVESLVIAIRTGMNVGQVPVEMHTRQAGTPSHSPVKATLFLARLAIAVIFAFIHPRVSMNEPGGTE